MLQDRSLFSLGSDVRFVSRSALTLLIVETYNDFVRFHGAPHSFPLMSHRSGIADGTVSLPIRSAHNTPRNSPHIGVPAAIRSLPPHFLYALPCHSVLLYGVSFSTRMSAPEDPDVLQVASIHRRFAKRSSALSDTLYWTVGRTLGIRRMMYLWPLPSVYIAPPSSSSRNLTSTEPKHWQRAWRHRLGM